MATRAPTLWQRFAGWCHRNLPTRESLEGNRMLRPVAHRVLALDWVAALPLPTALGALGAQLSGMVCYTGLVFVFCRWWVFADRSAAQGQNELR